jgi:2-polyprenyl-3-methyl-5-hydroxy-6-metoxy-1,4-benzoquinol methylase
MSALRRHRRDWDDLARLDPLWAIASAPRRRFGGWDEEAFMASGRRKAEGLLRRLEELGVPARRERALDFGCGVGRLALPLADAFDRVTGVDIAPAMIEQARARAAGRPGVEFVLNDREDLAVLGDARYDLVYSGLVLQHLPSRELALGALVALAARVAPGGVLVAQIPVGLSLRHRLQPGRRAYDLLRRLGVPRGFVYRRLRLQPMRMTWAPRADVERCLAGLRVLAAEERDAGGVRSLTIYAGAE